MGAWALTFASISGPYVRMRATEDRTRRLFPIALLPTLPA